MRTGRWQRPTLQGVIIESLANQASVLTCNRVWRELQVGTVAWPLLRRAAARAVLFMRRA